MARSINVEGLAKIKQWEGLRLTAYQDSVGVWTIGYGHTSAAGAPLVSQGMAITTAQAEQILRQDLLPVEKRVERLVTVSLNDNQFAALVSFEFNTGKLSSSTLLKKLNAGDYNAVPGELNKWVYGTDRKTGQRFKIDGLVNRRAAEIGLWVKGAVVSSSTEQVATKKVSFADTAIQPENVMAAGGLLSGLSGFATGAGPMQWAFAAIMVAAFGIGAFFLFKRMRSHEGD